LRPPFFYVTLPLPMSILTRAEIEAGIRARPPLVEEYLNLADQLQPNGIDLTLREIARLTTPGQIGASNSGRILAGTEPLPFAADGFISLVPGSYLITYNEVVNLPEDLTALGRPRSSLLRCGADIGTAVWDAGYRGRSQSLLTVHHRGGLRLAQNARIVQLVFFRLDSPTAGYTGQYQRENIAPR
jgi:dUTP pyrophosphatase